VDAESPLSLIAVGVGAVALVGVVAGVVYRKKTRSQSAVAVE